MSHWTDGHITYDEESGEYTGWDETGADAVLVSSQRDLVVAALIEYAEKLERLEL